MTEQTDRKLYQRSKEPIPPLLVNINDGARALGIGRTKMLEIVHCGALKTVTLGKQTMVTMESIKHVAQHGIDPALLNQRESQAA